jgi:glycosyltransferase involved in cell wall biosynthesis
MMSGGPRFSIVTVCLDAQAHIAGAIGSVLEQSYEDYEYLIVDGGSNDRTLDIVREYEPRFAGRMRWSSAPDRGLYDAMNRALGGAAGEYVEFLGADDRLMPDALRTVARVTEAPVRPDIVSGSTRVAGPDGSWDEPPRLLLRRGLPARMPASHQSTFMRREAIEAAGGFDLRFSVAADYDLYLRLVERHGTETLVDEVLSEFRLGGLSSRSAARTAREYRDIRVEHGANPALEAVAMLKSTASARAFAAWMRLFHHAPAWAARSRPAGGR